MTMRIAVRLLLAVATCACGALAVPAAAQPGDEVLLAVHPYVGGRLGVASPFADDGGDDASWAFGRGHGAGLAGGARYRDFAAEVELALATLNAADRHGAAERMTGQEHLASLHVAGRWQPEINALFYGVAGAGLGVTRVDWDQVRRGEAQMHAADEVPSYALEAGIGSRFWGALAFEVTWRRAVLGEFDYVEADGRPARMPRTRHDLLLMGLRYDL